MLIANLLKHAASDLLASPSVHHECNACGATMDTPDQDCPYCGDSRIATYRI